LPFKACRVWSGNQGLDPKTEQMPPILIVGIVILVGFLCGEALKALGLPKVTGYILGGVLLNPGLFNIVPADFIEHSGLITNISLSFITFSVGGTLSFGKLRKLGRVIFSVTIFEAEMAFLLVFAGFLLFLPFLVHMPNATLSATFIPAALLLGCLASPTDPSASLAVVHEYKAEGEVASTVLGAAAFDDALGIINYSFATVVAALLVVHGPLDLSGAAFRTFVAIGGAVLLGIVLGSLFNMFINFFNRETEGALIVAIFAVLFICFGLAKVLEFDELLSTMTMGVVVVNYNRLSEKIFSMIERYTEEFIFVLFFTLSGMHLNFSTLSQAALPILLFFILRTTGKSLGAWGGAVISGADAKVRRYVWGGLLPQGGIVVGLALLIQGHAAFSGFADLVLNVVIGATIVHEFIGPISSKIALSKAGEI
jgi:Kef-type K+ transport system membrane component KefB